MADTRYALTKRQAEAWSYLTNEHNEEVLYGGAKGGGKVAPLWTVVHTPFGPKLMDDINIGDLVSDPTTGTYCKVIAVHPQPIQPMYKFIFDDGAEAVTGMPHLWSYYVTGRKRRDGANRFQRNHIGTTSDIIDLFNDGYKIRIPLSEPLQFSKNGKTGYGDSLDPYFIGLLLGDGHLKSCEITTADEEIATYLKSIGYKQRSAYQFSIKGQFKAKIKQWLRNHLLIKDDWYAKSSDKYIPDYVKTSNIHYRYSIIQGLMDSDGTVDDRGRCYFSTTSNDLALDVQYIIRSLGGKCRLRERHTTYFHNNIKKNGKKSYCLRIWLEDTSMLFRLKRKIGRCKEGWNGGYELTRKLENIEYCGDEEGKCITVDSPYGLYITDDFIVTHNSHLMCLWAFYWTNHLIEYFALPRNNNPIPVGFLGRRQSVDFNHTTLETWKRIIPSDLYEIREQDKEIVIGGRAKIWFGGLDRSENLNKFNSAELAFFGIDQAEETERKDISVLMGSLRLTVKGRKPPYKIFYTANPAECWLKQDFVSGKKDDNVYIPALFTDNPYLPEDYEKTLDKAFGDDIELLKAYKLGDWDVISRDRIAIPSNYVQSVESIKIFESLDSKVISCDPATGGDECVVYVFSNSKIIDSKILHYTDTMKIAGELMLLAYKHDIHNFAIDSIGIGKGLVDRLGELEQNVMAINSAEGASGDRYYNKRTEMWWYVREKFQNKEIEYPADDEIVNQLSSVRFNIVNSNGKIQLEPKSEVKKRIGRSPDRADAYIYGLWGLQFFKEEKKDPRVFANLEDKQEVTHGNYINRFGWSR